MITTGSKLWFAVTGFAVVAAVAYFAASDSENFGTLVLISVAVAAFVLGVVSVVVRDAEGAPVGAAVGSGSTAATGAGAVTQQLPAAWPALAAFGAGVTVI